MKQEKKSFVMSFDWYDSIKECTVNEKGWILEAVYRYQLYGEVPDTDDRFLKVIFDTMKKFFDYNSERYEEKKILNSLNQKKRWMKERGDADGVRTITEETDYLKGHTVEEYMRLYGRIQPNTDTDTVIGTDYVTDDDTENESVYEDNTVTDSDNDSVGEDEPKERKQVTEERFEQYCHDNGYTFDYRKVFRTKRKPMYEDELQNECELYQSLEGR